MSLFKRVLDFPPGRTQTGQLRQSKALKFTGVNKGFSFIFLLLLKTYIVLVLIRLALLDVNGEVKLFVKFFFFFLGGGGRVGLRGGVRVDVN